MRGTVDWEGREKKLLFSGSCGSITGFSFPRRLWQLPVSQISPHSHIAIVAVKHNGFSDFCANSCSVVKVTINSSFSDISTSSSSIYFSMSYGFFNLLQCFKSVFSECSLSLLLQLPDHYSSSFSYITLIPSPYIKSLYSKILAGALFYSLHLVIGNESSSQEAQNFKNGNCMGIGPGWCCSVGCALAYKGKSHWFNSWSGHLPGLWGVEATNRCFSPFFLLPFPALYKNK